jgi:hypothetical protein
MIYAVEDIPRQIHSTENIAVDKQQQIQLWLYTIVYTAAYIQLQIHSGRYTAAPNQNTQWWIHSRSIDDPSTTTLVSVRNTWVIQSALTALIEPHAL